MNRVLTSRLAGWHCAYQRECRQPDRRRDPADRIHVMEHGIDAALSVRDDPRLACDGS